MAKPGPVPPETITLAGQVRAELDKVDQLLEGLLVLARAQHGALPGRAVLPLDYVVSAALAAYEDAITARNLAVQHLAGSEGIWVEGSQPLLRRMADNVIGNAVSHNRDGGWIRITTTAGDGAARLIIENGGDILVAAITEAHRGSLQLQARPGGGLTVTITLPLAPRAAAITASQAVVPV